MLCLQAADQELRARTNEFGTLHNAIEDYSGFGPHAWSTKGAGWCPECKIEQAGLLVTPGILWLRLPRSIEQIRREAGYFS